MRLKQQLFSNLNQFNSTEVFKSTNLQLRKETNEAVHDYDSYEYETYDNYDDIDTDIQDSTVLSSYKSEMAKDSENIREDSKMYKSMSFVNKTEHRFLDSEEKRFNLIEEISRIFKQYLPGPINGCSSSVLTSKLSIVLIVFSLNLLI